MQFSTLSVISLATGMAAAVNHPVMVGQSGLAFTPNSVNASKGDTVTFHFYPKNHNVVQAAFASPCTPSSGGFYSGFHATTSGEANQTFMITVTDTTKPIWFYCSQTSHCQGGMVGVINQASTGANTIEAFAAAAKKTSNSTTPTVTAGTGGMLMANTQSSTSSSSSSSASGSANSTTSSTSGASSVTISGLMALVAGAGAFLL